MFNTLDELAVDALAQAIPEKPLLVNIFIQRLGWRGDSLTLKEVGEVAGLTRERVRQIEARTLAKLRNPSFPRYPGLLNRVIDELNAARYIEEIPKRLLDAGLILSEDWQSSGIDLLINTIGDSSVRLRWSELKRRLQSLESVADSAEAAIRKYQDKSGFVLRSTLALADPSLDLDSPELMTLLTKRLKRLAVTENLIFAPKSEKAHVRRMLAEQLSFAPNGQLSSREALVGLDRDLRGRGARAIGEASDVMECIASVFSEFKYLVSEDEVHLQAGEVSIIRNDTIPMRIAHFLENQHFHAAHIYDIYAYCIEQSMNISSIAHDVLYSSMIRRSGDVFFVVGHEPTSSVQEELVRSSKIRYKDAGYLEFDPRVRSGSVQMNPVWIRSGKWFSSSELNHLIGSSPEFLCGMCGSEERFTTRASPRPDSLDIPVALINHMVKLHRVGAMRWVSFRVSGRSVVFF